jgi:hypothetical protein
MENVYLKPVFSSKDIGSDLIFINCTLGYNGNINLLFAEKKYDYLKSRIVRFCIPIYGRTDDEPSGPIYRTVTNFKIFPETPQNYKLVILEENKILELNDKSINYTHGLQIDSDKYCLACHSKTDAFKNSIEKNCEIFSFNGKLLNEFDIGTGINGIQTNNKKEIWISYNDNGIFGANNGDGKDFIEKTGLNCFDANGNVLYRYDNPNLFICSCDSLNVYSDKEILLNIYCGNLKSWHAFTKIKNKKFVKVVEWRVCTDFIPSYESMIFIENTDYNDGIKSRFSFVDIENCIKEEVTYEFLNENNERLNCVHAQKDNLFFWKNNSLYIFDIRQLLKKGENRS